MCTSLEGLAQAIGTLFCSPEKGLGKVYYEDRCTLYQLPRYLSFTSDEKQLHTWDLQKSVDVPAGR